jgi:hypothetical protein
MSKYIVGVRSFLPGFEQTFGPQKEWDNPREFSDAEIVAAIKKHGRASIDVLTVHSDDDGLGPNRPSGAPTDADTVFSIVFENDYD